MREMEMKELTSLTGEEFHEWMAPCREAGPIAWWVLLMIQREEMKRGVYGLTQTEIAKTTEFSARRVRTAIKKLLALDYISETRQDGKTSVYTTRECEDGGPWHKRVAT